tara:strand:+ start:292 stop:525 length:234 start_codon:yes stop_codon:yes gene_type:complete
LFLFFYVVDLVIVTGIVILAPLSKPVTVKVVTNVEFVPNKVLIVVALKFICVPVTVADTFVPIVCVEVAFAFVVAAD